MSEIEQKARELFDAIGATDWDITAHTTPGTPDGPPEQNYNISFDQDKVLEIIKSALQAERDAALEEAAICAGSPKQSHGTRSEIMRAIRSLKSQPPTEKETDTC